MRRLQGANYRLIDIPVSNCINSDIVKIYCLTQFNSASLNRHLSSAYVRSPACGRSCRAHIRSPPLTRAARRTRTWAATRARGSLRCWRRSRARRTRTGSRAPPTPCASTCGSSRCARRPRPRPAPPGTAPPRRAPCVLLRALPACLRLAMRLAGLTRNGVADAPPLALRFRCPLPRAALLALPAPAPPGRLASAARAQPQTAVRDGP